MNCLELIYLLEILEGSVNRWVIVVYT
jgi:hypothetical protein